MTEVVMALVDGCPQQALQAIPGGEDLPQRPLVGHAAILIDGNALWHFDPEILGASAACFQRVEQFGVTGNSSATADQFDTGALIHIHAPADLRKKAAENSPDIDPPIMM